MTTQAALLRRAQSLHLLYSTGHLWSYHSLCCSNNWACVGRCSWRAKIKATSVGASDSNWGKQLIALCPPVFNLPPYSKYSNAYRFTTRCTTKQETREPMNRKKTYAVIHWIWWVQQSSTRYFEFNHDSMLLYIFLIIFRFYFISCLWLGWCFWLHIY